MIKSFLTRILKRITCITLVLHVGFSHSMMGYETSRYEDAPIEPATAIAIAQAAVQVWQALGPKDQSIGQILTMLQIMDEKLNLINKKMDIVIEELKNVDENTYLFFKTSDGQVLINNIITFDRALFDELQDMPLSLRKKAKKEYIINQQQTLKQYADKLHDVFSHLQKFGKRPEIASYIAVSFQMENRIYEKLIEAESKVLPKKFMKARQDNYLKFFSQSIVDLNNDLRLLNEKRPNIDKNQIEKVLGLKYQKHGKWIKNTRGVEFIETVKSHEGRGGRRFNYHKIIAHYFTLTQTDFLKSTELDYLRNDLGYSFNDWFYGFNLKTSVNKQEQKNKNRKKGSGWQKKGHNFIPGINAEVKNKLPKLFQNGRDTLIVLCYSIENVSKSLFTIQENEQNQIYIN